MTNSNPKLLLKLYKYNNLRFSSTKMGELTLQSLTVKPEELPFEMNLLENSPRRNDIPEEKHPDDEEAPEDIPYEEVIPEDAPQRKNVPEKIPIKETPEKGI
ncbi:MAG: hypothetical protein H0X02_11645 [Nitrosomonas sp.]|nr:hypothetical protein [Nitrosomonas sp.]